MMSLHFICFVLVLASTFFTNDAVFHKRFIESRIYKGFDGERNQFPFFVFLEIDLINGTEVVNTACGGSLISDEWILTAAHCLVDAKEIRIHLGALKLRAVFEEGRALLVSTRENFYPHPYFGPNTIINDIGLLRLPVKIEFSKSIKPIQLPNSCEINENVDVIAMGHGVVKKHTYNDVAPMLQYAPMQTTSMLECYDTYPRMYWRKSVLCTKSSEERSVCHGDSGGSLVRQNDTTLIGIASFVNVEGCFSGHPQVFTYVVPYHPWISKITGIELIRCAK